MAGGLKKSVRQWADDLLSMVFPHRCEVCGAPLVRGEELMCLHCEAELPRCRFHQSQFNHMHERLLRTALVDRAAGYFFYYRQSSYVKLIHEGKYNDRPIVLRKLARRFAAEIEPDGFFYGIDVITVVPLHWFKRLRRGYNQSLYIAQGLADVTHIPVAEALVATHGHATQTRKDAFGRWLNAQGLYKVGNPSKLEGLHVLLVDDVFTTGATLLACCEAIHAACPTARISVLTLGVAQS